MPALMPTEFKAVVRWIGRVSDRDRALGAEPLERAMLAFGGIEGEAHGGITRPSCSRVLSQHPQRGTEIANVRQLSIVSAEELAETAKAVGIEEITPALVGASLMIDGLPDFTRVPPSSRLQAPSGATLVIDMENRPCHLVSREIEARHAGHGKRYKPAAAGKRGVTAWVERPGEIRLGDELVLHIPDQPVWQHLGAARGG